MSTAGVNGTVGLPTNPVQTKVAKNVEGIAMFIEFTNDDNIKVTLKITMKITILILNVLDY